MMSGRRTGETRGFAAVIGLRYFGQFPKEAPRSVQLNWWRTVQLKTGIPALPPVVVASLLIDVTWVYVAFGVFAVWWLWGFARLTRDIQRARRAELADQS